MTIEEIRNKLLSFKGERTALPYEGYSEAELCIIEALLENDNQIYQYLVKTISQSNQSVGNALTEISQDSLTNTIELIQKAVNELEYKRIRDLSFILSMLQAGKKTDQKYVEKYDAWCEDYDKKHQDAQ